MYKYVFAVLILCFCAPAFSAGPVKYPNKVDGMNDVEFFQWAVTRNQRARKAWEAKAAALPPKYFNTPVRITEGRVSVRGRGGQRGGFGVRSYTRYYRFQNPDYTSPGPLTIVNPYVKPKTKK